MPRPSAVLALSALVGALLAGCAAEPAPEPTGPLFTSEAEAFAAAEETYRAYVDALNRVDLADPETFEDVFALTTGEMNANSRRSLSQLHAKRATLSGRSVVAAVSELDVTPGSTTVRIAVCLDVSSIELSDSTGNSLVSAGRPEVQALEIVLVQNDKAPRAFLLSEMNGRLGAPEC